MANETVRMVLGSAWAQARTDSASDNTVPVHMEFPDEHRVILRVYPSATTRGILTLTLDTGLLSQKEIYIETPDPTIAATLAWYLKPWLRPGRWWVNGRSITA